MNYTLDANIVIYAFENTDAVKHGIARRLLDHVVATRGIAVRQVFGEVINAAHRKPRLSLANARMVVGLLELATNVLPTGASATLEASDLAERHRMQYFDALICTIARQAGAAVLFSEDMHDGLRIGALTIVNPFAAANSGLLSELLSGPG